MERSGFQLAPGAPAYYQDHVRWVMAPFVERLVAIAVRPGNRVLDVACGTGFATRAAASAAGSGGAVTGVDINGGMVALARELEAEHPISYEEGSALALPYPEGVFDSVICQQGLQFFPDPSAGLREMNRVLRPGGILAATVWAPLELSPYFHSQILMLMDHCGLDMGVASQAFPPGGASTVLSWAEAANLDRPEVDVVEVEVALPPFDTYIPSHLRALPWAAQFFELPEAIRARAVEEMKRRLAPYMKDDGSLLVPTSSLFLKI